MQVFDLLPERFFSILASSNKVIYVEALFVLRSAFKDNELTISRSYLSNALADHLYKMLMNAEFSEEDEEQGFTSVGISGKVSTIIMRLKKCGWIDFEYSDSSSMEENVTIPDYSLSFINTLYALTEEKKSEYKYKGYIFASYASLKTAQDSGQDYYSALQMAYLNTIDYQEALKLLYQNIRYYILRATNLSVNALLEEHFDNYSVKITKALLDPIKTTDSVQRYKFQILSILEQWEESEEILKTLVDAAIREDSTLSLEVAKDDVLNKIVTIKDTYESVERTILKIDNRHRQYMHLSIESLRYKMGTGKDTGTLINKLLGAATPHSKMGELLKTTFNISEFPFASSLSLYSRVERDNNKEDEVEVLKEYSDNEEIISSFLDEIDKQYTSDKIDAFVLSQLNGRDAITSEDFLLKDNEDFIMFLFASLRNNEENCPYTVSFDKDDSEVSVQSYTLPRVNFAIKEII